MKLTYQGVVYSKKDSKSVITKRRTGKPNKMQDVDEEEEK